MHRDNDLRPGFHRQPAKQAAVPGFGEEERLGEGWGLGKMMIFYDVMPGPLFQKASFILVLKII